MLIMVRKAGPENEKARGQPRFSVGGMQLEVTRDYAAASGPWFLGKEFAVS
jgi:hypothetical protein